MAKLSASPRARRRGWLLPLRGSRALRTALCASVALLQAYFLADAVRLHAHGWAGVAFVADLPAEYHHHDYGFVPDRDVQTVDTDDCLGCRLERTAGLPILGVPGVVLASRTTGLLPGALSFTLPLLDRYQLPRAPPHA